MEFGWKKKPAKRKGKKKPGKTDKTTKAGQAPDSMRRLSELAAQIEDGFRLGCEKEEWMSWTAELKGLIKELGSR